MVSVGFNEVLLERINLRGRVGGNRRLVLEQLLECRLPPNLIELGSQVVLVNVEAGKVAKDAFEAGRT